MSSFPAQAGCSVDQFTPPHFITVTLQVQAHECILKVYPFLPIAPLLPYSRRIDERTVTAAKVQPFYNCGHFLHFFVLVSVSVVEWMSFVSSFIRFNPLQQFCNTHTHHGLQFVFCCWIVLCLDVLDVYKNACQNTVQFRPLPLICVVAINI